MITKQPPTDFPEQQGAIYGLALSLDAFLLNGIPSGVLHGDVFPDFLAHTAGHLLRDLVALERQAPLAPGRSEVAALLGSLRSKCEELIDLIAGLRAFTSLTLQQLRSEVARIPPLRGECVQLIQKLEKCFRTPKPFYPSRPADSTASVDDFLARLDGILVEAWAASNAVAVGPRE